MTHTIELEHPLVRHHLTILRDARTPPSLFREQTRRLAMLLGAAATADLPLKDVSVSTPVTDYMRARRWRYALHWFLFCEPA